MFIRLKTFVQQNFIVLSCFIIIVYFVYTKSEADTIVEVDGDALVEANTNGSEVIQERSPNTAKAVVNQPPLPSKDDKCTSEKLKSII